MTINSLTRHIDKLLAEIHQRLPERREPYRFMMHLFPEQEQAALNDFLLEIAYTGSLDYLTNNQLDQYRYWLNLEIALTHEDSKAAQEYRQLLRESQEASSERTPERLIARFHAIDTRLFQTPISPGPGIQLTNYHRLKDKIAQGEQLTGIEWNQLEWWGNYYEQYTARIASYAAHRERYATR